MFGALLALLFVAFPISLAMGMILAQGPDVIYQWLSHPSWITVNAAYSNEGIVAADDVRCSDIGASLLAAGGNAVDAAIGTVLCLGVVSPGSSGLGGGSFLLFYNYTSRQSVFIDGRETAPNSAYSTMFVNNSDLSKSGGLAIAIPGQLRALRHAWELHGSLAWYDIVIPAAKLAKSFRVSDTLAKHVQNIKTTLKDPKYAELKTYLMGQYNRLVGFGDMLENEALSNTLTMIAAVGDSYFYDGQVGCLYDTYLQHKL